MVCATAALTLFLLSRASAQTPDPSLQFEVASVKPGTPAGLLGMRMSIRGGPGTNDPGLFRCENCPLEALLEHAFDLQSYQLTGPEWLQNTRFDLSAKVPLGTTKAQFRQMLQNLLTERFQMKFHRDTKEMPVFNLVVAKNGPKFAESVPIETAPEDDPPPPSGPPKIDANGFPILPKGKGFIMRMANNRAALRASGELMESLATLLAGQLDRPVLNATRLQGKYEIALTWVPGDSPDSPGPNLYTALQEQLGLKLESKKGSVPVVVIDHIEKTPTEN